MGNTRRHFLRTIPGVAALPAIGSVISTEPWSGLGAASSADVRAQFPLLGDFMNGHSLVYLDSAATTQRPPICKNLYPNLSQYAANRAQTVQSQPKGVFSFHQLTIEPDAITRFAKPL